MGAEVIGIAGTGRMGTAFARRLIECGHHVLVWNRTPERTAAAAEAGAEVVALPELGRADVVLTSMTDFTALEPVYAAEGLLGPLLRGKLVIEMSTLLPQEQQALEGRVLAAGAEFLECPVGGTVAPTLKGQLLGFAGGSDAAWQRAEPVLAQLCRRVEHLGPVGTGARMKLAVNLPLAIYWAVLGETLQLLEGTGLPAERIVSLIADSSAGPAVLKSRAQVVSETLDGRDQPGTFDIAGLHKDLALALALADREGGRLPVSETVLESYRAALGQGFGQCDGATLTRLLRGHREG